MSLDCENGWGIPKRGTWNWLYKHSTRAGRFTILPAIGVASNHSIWHSVQQGGFWYPELQT